MSILMLSLGYCRYSLCAKWDSIDRVAFCNLMRESVRADPGT